MNSLTKINVEKCRRPWQLESKNLSLWWSVKFAVDAHCLLEAGSQLWIFAAEVYVCLKFGVQKKIHLTFIHQWVAYTDNCGGDGHTYRHARRFQDLNVTHCSFSPTHPFETAQAHYAFRHISLFFFQMSHSSKLKSKLHKKEREKTY